MRDSFIRYSDERRHPGAKKWFQRVVSRAHHYGNIVDVFVQHNPEYTALAWGAMKLVIVDAYKAAQNHENTICFLAKTLSQIAACLPRVELATILYPTNRMREAVGTLYASLLRFFIRAREWCSEGSVRHLIHSITRPVELRYRDLLEDITAASREIDQLASSGARVEIREMNSKLNDVISKLDSFHAMHSSALVDTNQRLSDLQFSQIMSHLSAGRLGDPLRAIRFHQSMQRRLAGSRAFEVTNKFWQSRKLNEWSSLPESRLAVLNGNFRARFAMRNFSVNIIQQLQSKHIPVLWVLAGPGDENEMGRVSVVDLFKHLVFQAFKLDQGSASENSLSLQCGRFHRATSEHDWLQLLGSALSQVQSQVYLVIDLSTLDRSLEPEATFSWVTAFCNLFEEIKVRSPGLQVKVLLFNEGASNLTTEAESARSDVSIPVKVTQTPVRRRKKLDRSMSSRPKKGYSVL
ncbi:hypothetical protein ColTof4_07697 [Colletotrichum tofieldiae]|nr:hypothetical protein ColTof4_07697 [Colletotrichum tofieldiae]